jgi:Xaa-Pro dipeptidase
LPDALRSTGRIGIEPQQMPPPVRGYLETLVGAKKLGDVTAITSDMRMIKTPQEQQMARHAGQVAMAMMQAGRETIADGVAEFEVALATSEAGTRKAAALLTAHYTDSCMSPNTQFLQIMASGQEIAKPHHRASTRIMRYGEPVFLCFCGMTNFHRFKLGFDRTFWIGEARDEDQIHVYETAVASQKQRLRFCAPGSPQRPYMRPMLTLFNRPDLNTRFAAGGRLDSVFLKSRSGGLVGSEESDLGFPLHPECAIQTYADWYFLHGIFG